LNPYLTSYYALPVFAFYPVLIAILGVNARPIIAISWAWAVVAVVINTLAGFQQVPAVFTHQVYP
jgi:NitT/TauT family transport system permease protein